MNPKKLAKAKAELASGIYAGCCKSPFHDWEWGQFKAHCGGELLV